MSDVRLDLPPWEYSPRKLVATAMLAKARVQLHQFVHGKRPRRQQRLPKARPPTSVALAYLAQLRAVLAVAHQAVDTHVVQRLPRLLGTVEWEHSYRAPRHFAVDAGAADIRDAVNAAKQAYVRGVHASKVATAAKTAGERVDRHQEEQLNAQVRAAIGVSLPLRQSTARLQSFVQENVALIGSVTDRYFSEVEKLVLRSANSGGRADVLARELEERFDVSESRAALIARDQTSKLMGALNEARQTDLGVKSFIWRTVEDERVRESHAAHDGKTYDWDDPPSNTGAPGEDYQCRCWAEPNLAELTGAMEEEADTG